MLGSLAVSPSWRSLAAYRSDGGNLRLFTVYEDDNPPYAVHSQQGSSNSGMPTDAERLYSSVETLPSVMGRPD